MRWRGPPGAGVRVRTARFPRGKCRQPDHELTPLARARAVGLDGAAVQLDQAADHRQADAQTALGAVQGGVGLGEQVEHPRQHVGRDARARIPDPDRRRVAFPPGRQGDVPALPGELDGVVEEVADDLGQPCRVGVDADGPGGQGHAQALPLRFGQRAGRLGGAGHDVGQVHRPPAQLHLAPRDARYVEQVVHQVREASRLALDDVAHVIARSV